MPRKARPGAAAVPTERVEREGSPWTGLGAVMAKEVADHLTSARMRILEVLIVLTAGGTVWAAMQSIQQTVAYDRFLFLKLFTTAKDPIPAFVSFLGFLVPLIAIALAFDSINGEFSRRTLARVLAQPIYRDALLLGKFLGGLATLALVFTAIWLLIIGMGIFGLGVAPNTEEVGRMLWLLFVTIFYGGIWLALAMVFSIVFRQPATAAMASIAVWLFYMVFWDIVSSMLAQFLVPNTTDLNGQVLLAQVQMFLSRLSPNTLFSESVIALLQPNIRSLGLVFPSQLQGAVMGTPLPLGQSLLLIWPQVTGLIAVTILLFALGYVLFQREEIRA